MLTGFWWTSSISREDGEQHRLAYGYGWEGKAVNDLGKEMKKISEGGRGSDLGLHLDDGCSINEMIWAYSSRAESSSQSLWFISFY